jgi:DNA-binding protein HU-beta
MNKSELISKMAEDSGISKAQAQSALNSMIEGVGGSMKKGDKVTLVGFGTWSVSRRNARTGRNPQTGAEIQIKAKNVVKFKAGSDLSGKVN